uniref:Transposase n=1 Tax=Panagrolaimus superbus TaxID=310955 RepID=A0A914YEW5_9BILA
MLIDRGLGVKRGKSVALQEINISRKATKTAAMKTSQIEMNALKPVLSAASEIGEICFAVDHGKRLEDYLSLVAHFTIEDADGLQMIARPIGFLRVNGKDAATVFKQIQELCQNIGINPHYLSKCAVISDEGSNMVKAVKGKFKQELRCACHVTCTTVYHIFVPYKKNTFTEAELEQIKIGKALLESCKILSSLARTSKTFKFSKKPRQFVSTRFMSCLWVMEDMLANFNVLYQLSQDPPAMKSDDRDALNLVVANKRKLEFLVELLKPIEEAITKFEGEKYPSLHLVSLFFEGQIVKARVSRV